MAKPKTNAGVKQVSFTTDKRGKPRAYRVDMSQMRNFPIGLDRANLMVSTGEAIRVPFRPFGPAKKNSLAAAGKPWVAYLNKAKQLEKLAKSGGKLGVRGVGTHADIKQRAAAFRARGLELKAAATKKNTGLKFGKALLGKAARLGVAAGKAGRPGHPGDDAELGRLLDLNTGTERPAGPLLTAWSRGWRLGVKQKTNGKKRAKRNKSAVPAKVLAGHRAIWGGTIPAGAMAQLEKEYKRAADTRAIRGRAKKHAKGNGRRRSNAPNLERLEAAVAKAKEAYTSYRPAPGVRSISAGSSRPSASSILAQSRLRKAWQDAESKLAKAAARSNPAPRRRRNSGEEDSAADRYEYFHGREPETVTDITTPVKYHGTLSGIGRLVKIRIQNGRYKVVLGFKGTLLSQNKAGTQLFFSGGNQSVSLADFGITNVHENEFLGAMTDVWYHTVKDHLGDDGGDAIYHHRFKKRGRGLPIILYDVRNKLLHVAGGGYTIPAEGIDG